MPPMYSYRCESCEKKLDVLRTFDGYSEVPTVDEGGTCANGNPSEQPETATPHIWMKVIHAPLLVRGAGWGNGRKGHW